MLTLLGTKELRPELLLTVTLFCPNKCEQVFAQESYKSSRVADRRCAK